jgi:hypothetical protein
VIDERDGSSIAHDLVKQRLDELEQVVDLLELAARVLVHLAVARQDMKLLEQLDGLAGANFVSLVRHGGTAPDKSPRACDSLQKRRNNRVSLPKSATDARKTQEQFMHGRADPFFQSGQLPSRISVRIWPGRGGNTPRGTSRAARAYAAP